MNDIEYLAKQAAVQASSPSAVGDLLERIEEAEPGVVTYKFESKLKGYVGWRWAVSLFFEGEQVSISEVNLVAGENSIVAPKWIPWSERLADYKALQAALEQQAREEAAEAEAEALAAAEAENTEAEAATENPEADDEDDGFAEVEEIEESEADASGVPKTQDAKDDADDAGSNEVGFFRIFRRGKKRK